MGCWFLFLSWGVRGVRVLSVAALGRLFEAFIRLMGLMG